MCNPVDKVRKPELTALTSLRGIAALFVFAHHFMFVLLWDIAKLVPSNLFFKSYLWVDLFFILSGFVLAYVYQEVFQPAIKGSDYRHFMRARFARIYPLHFFVLLLFVLFELAQWAAVQTQLPGAEHLVPPFTKGQSLWTLFTNLTLVQTLHWAAYWNQPAWSISAEWLIYFCVPFVIYHVYRASITVQIMLACLVVMLLGIIEYHFGNLGYDYAGWPMLVRCLGECLLGALALRCYQSGYFARFASGALLIPVLVINILILALPGPGVTSVIGFVWLVLCAARVPSTSKHLLNSPPLVYLGKISYSIYMVHWLVLDLLREGALFFTGNPLVDNLSLVEQIIVFVAAGLFVIALAALTYHFIETPWRKRLLR
jgi:peptidoglycan/LPS O-acetylase OafA/YrhL